MPYGTKDPLYPYKQWNSPLEHCFYLIRDSWIEGTLADINRLLKERRERRRN